MRFKIDENLPVEAAQWLRQAGHKASTGLEEDLGGEADLNLASRCRSEQRILITLDADFADIRSYPPDQYAGLVVLRLKRQDKLHILEILKSVTPLLEREPIHRRLWVVEEHRVRIRG